jgi:hypothetical protein
MSWYRAYAKRADAVHKAEQEVIATVPTTRQGLQAYLKFVEQLAVDLTLETDDMTANCATIATATNAMG